MKTPRKMNLMAAASMLSLALAVPFAFGQSTTTSPPPGPGWGAGMHSPMMQRMGNRGWMMMRALRRLDLTADQKAEINQIREKSRPEFAALLKELRTKRQELRAAYQNGTFNEALATQTLTAMAPLEAKLMAGRYNVQQQIMNVLTPEQKARLDQMRERFNQRRPRTSAPQ